MIAPRALLALALIALAVRPAPAQADDRPDRPAADNGILVGSVADPASMNLPVWTRGYDVRRFADGRVMLVGRINGLRVWALPPAWIEKDAPMNPDRPTMNFGVDLRDPDLGQVEGSISTNDPAFDPAILRPAADPLVGTPAEQCPNPAPDPFRIPAELPGTNLGMAAVLIVGAGALVIRRLARGR